MNFGKGTVMAEKKEYRSAARSRRFIRQALMELLREKKPEKITVTDIVNRADINRSTFYAHYADVRALMEEIQNEFVERSLSAVKDMDFLELIHSPIPFLRKLIEIANENRELYAVLGKSMMTTNQLEKIKVILVEKALNLPVIPEEIRNRKNFRIRLHFFVGGIINAYQQYLVGNLDATSDEIIEEIAILIKSSSHTILDVQQPGKTTDFSQSVGLPMVDSELDVEK